MERGFSLLETLVVISLIVVLAGVPTAFGSTSVFSHNLVEDVRRIPMLTRAARLEAMYGACSEPACAAVAPSALHATSTSLLWFRGDTFNQRIPTADREYSLASTISPPAVTISFTPYTGRTEVPTRIDFPKLRDSRWSISVSDGGVVSTDHEQK